MGCCGGTCSCGKKEPNVREESRHLVQVPAGGMKLPDWSKGTDHFSFEVPVVEVRFKNKRKAWYSNVGGLELAKDDRVVVEDGDGQHLGTVSMSGKAAREKYNSGIKHESGLSRVIRKASLGDLQKWLDAKKGEYAFLQEARKIAAREGLPLSISDVENRTDGKKLSIYYTSGMAIDEPGVAIRFEKILKVKVEMCMPGSKQDNNTFDNSFNNLVKEAQAEYN